jgi:hypothetical protein
MKKFLLLLLFTTSFEAFSQTLVDGLMMPKNDFCTGFIYSQDSWDEYWEGELKRSNENIGELRTNSLTWVGNYGVTDKINVIAMVPYVKAEATQGVLHKMEGIQDLTLGIKYNFFRKDYASSSLRTFAVVGFSTPLSDYTPDYFPLSLGTSTTNIFYRGTMFYKFLQSFYINGSAAYTWRSNAILDRSSYYTKDKLYMTNEVEMPNVFDYTVAIGYLKSGLQGEIFYMQQNTLGGSDIRRQDMPFVSNRMNASKVGGLIMYYLPKPKGLAIRATYMTTVAGRNAGISNTWAVGALYTIHFFKKTATAE